MRQGGIRVGYRRSKKEDRLFLKERERERGAKMMNWKGYTKDREGEKYTHIIDKRVWMLRREEDGDRSGRCTAYCDPVSLMDASWCLPIYASSKSTIYTPSILRSEIFQRNFIIFPVSLSSLFIFTLPFHKRISLVSRVRFTRRTKYRHFVRIPVFLEQTCLPGSPSIYLSIYPV